MIKLLELKELLIDLYKDKEKKINFLGKFFLGILIISKLNIFFEIGNFFNNTIITLVMGIICAFIPGSWLLLLLMAFIIVKISVVSIELALFTAILMIIAYMLFIGISPKMSYIIILVPLLFSFNIVYVVPIIAGLFIGPISILSIILGVCVYFFGKSIPLLVDSILVASEPIDSIMNIYNYFIESFLYNKSLLITLIVFMLVVIVTYIVSKLDFDYIWYIAIAAGGIVNLLGLIVGSILFNIDIILSEIIFGTIISMLISAIIQFFRFSLDYERTEKLQFEDDEYYYYVKAIPKVKISKAVKEVKKIE